MRLRLTKIDEFQFLTCLKHEVWGSKKARFKEWKEGDYLAFIVDKAIAGLAKVSGNPLFSDEIIWDNGLYPHRIPITFLHAMLPQNRPPILGEIRDALTSEWGLGYGWGIVNQFVLPEKSTNTIVSAITSHKNDLSDLNSNIELYLAEADQIRKKGKTKTIKKKEIKDITNIQIEPMEPSTSIQEDESAHSKVQKALIRLGKITGCSVWIALNDRNRNFQGKPLSDGCLTSLPNLGLSEEAVKRISLIDIIWIKQNAPVCAFEVETTTSIYSGLLRMSDLLSVVPALNIKLFIIAPKERQGKVLAELSRPTFQKIGLSDFCRYLPSEELESLVEKVKGFHGHVQPSILDAIALGLEEPIKGSLE
ncbi:MAG: hypothetical protein ACOZFS_06755 [Thermodesulfobacteriota bacterium]